MHPRRTGSSPGKLIALAALLAAGPAHAIYMQYGLDPQEIRAGEVDNGGLYVQAANTWLAATPAKPCTNQAGFALPACQAVEWARLYVTLWGGNRDYTNLFSVYLHSDANRIAQFTLGTSNDVNAAFQESTNCAYGLGFGVWLVSLPVAPGLLATDGSTNLFLTSVEDPSGNFDGRQIHLTLVAVYRDRALNNRLAYRVAEGPADIYRNQAGATNSRSVAFSGLDTNEVRGATLWAEYTYGDFSQNDRLYFNGVAYGGDNVASKQTNNTALTYVPDLVGFAVTNLAATNVVRFSVSTNEITGTCETSLRPHLAALAVSREPRLQVYEPAPGPDGLQLTWPASSGWVYRVEAATDLPAQDWAPLAGASNLIGSNAVMSATDAAAPALRLYRIARERP